MVTLRLGTVMRSVSTSMYGRHVFMFWLVAGVCLGVAMGQPGWWLLIVPGLLSFYAAVRCSASLRSVFLGALITGWLHKAVALWWVLDMYPLDWLPGSPVAELAGLLFVWLSTCLVLGLGLAIATAILWCTYQHWPRVALIVSPLSWIGGELLGAWLFSLYSWGPGSILHPFFAHGFIGYSVAHLAILYPVVAVSGVYGLSAFLSFLAALIVLPKQFSINKKILVICGVGIGLWVCFLFYRPVPTAFSETKTIATINTRFPSGLIADASGNTLKAQETAAAVGTALYLPSVDIIALPEYSRFTNNFSNPEEALTLLLQHPASSTAVLIDSGEVLVASGSHVTRAHFYDLRHQAVYQLDKQNLVAQGEYLPYLAGWLLRLFGQYDLLKRYHERHNYIPGQYTSYETIPSNVPMIMFCHESSLAQTLSSPGARIPVVVHPVSHGWFHDNKRINWQLEAMLRVQAIWNQKLIIQIGNMSPGKAFYPNGRIGYGEKLVDTTWWYITTFQY